MVGGIQVIEGVCQVLDRSDLADRAIEDLRRWGRWECSGRIIGLSGRKTHDVPFIHRAIVRIALSCPPQMKVRVAFVAELRKADPEIVKEVEEALELRKGK